MTTITNQSLVTPLLGAMDTARSSMEKELSALIVVGVLIVCLAIALSSESVSVSAEEAKLAAHSLQNFMCVISQDKTQAHTFGGSLRASKDNDFVLCLLSLLRKFKDREVTEAVGAIHSMHRHIFVPEALPSIISSQELHDNVMRKLYEVINQYNTWHKFIVALMVACTGVSLASFYHFDPFFRCITLFVGFLFVSYLISLPWPVRARRCTLIAVGFDYFLHLGPKLILNADDSANPKCVDKLNRYKQEFEVQTQFIFSFKGRSKVLDRLCDQAVSDLLNVIRDEAEKRATRRP